MGSKYYFEDKASQISLQYFLTYFFRNPTSFKYLAENNTIILKTDDYREENTARNISTYSIIILFFLSPSYQTSRQPSKDYRL